MQPGVAGGEHDATERSDPTTPTNNANNAPTEAAPVTAGSKYRQLQVYLYWLLEDEEMSSTPKLAKALGLFVMVCIAASVTAFCAASMPLCAYEEGTYTMLCDDVEEKVEPWHTIETFCIMVFTVEYVVKLWGCQATVGYCAFFKSKSNFIDLIAILPWYVDLIPKGEEGGDVGWLAVLRVVRLARVVRIFKTAKKLDGIQILMSTLVHSWSPLVMLFFFVVVCMILFSTLIYYLEQGTYSIERKQYIREDGSVSPFESIPHSCWWCLVTMTTVGYGDDVPVTTGGKALAMLTMFCGLVVLSLPITIIGANFDEQYRDHKREQEMKKRAQKVKANRGSAQGPAGGEDPAESEGVDLSAQMKDPGWMIKQTVQDMHVMLLQDVDSLMRRSEDDMKLRMMRILENARKDRERREREAAE